ncbi:MAG TPA: glycosyltransferase [Pyrinomonadaceae bacterium]|nr:glycosyltransferase [Pyrinomonadaceae bacterium]
MQPLVSVIMPAYNTETYIGDSIQSVRNQTYRNWELLVVDDGSTDKTAEIIRSFAAQDSRVKYVFQQNGRQAKARNTGIEKSSGTLLAFLDSDDLWLPEKLERQLQVMDEMNVDVVYSDGHIIYEPGSIPGATSFRIVPGTVAGREMLDKLLLHNHVPVQSVLVRLDCFRKAGPFDESPAFHGCEDYEMWLKLAATGAKFHGMSEKLIKYRRHPTATTHKNSKMFKPALRVVSRHLESGTLNQKQKNQRRRSLYRQLIAALVEEGELAEAREFLKEFSNWDRLGIVTSLQKMLLEISPGSFNTISRECLYRAEWHLQKLTGRINS